jgi:hypothetical protein
MTRLLPIGLLLGLLLVASCGKSADQPTRFNETLGDTPTGAPLAAGPIDTGILQDPANYKPASYQPLEGETPAGAAGAAEGPEAQAVRKVLSTLANAIFDLDVSTVLDSFVPAQVAALTEEDEYITNLNDMGDALRAYGQALKDKATGPELETLVKLFELLPRLAEPLPNALTISVTDEENAVATFDLARFQMPPELVTDLTEVVQMGASMAAQMGGGAAPAPGGSPPTGAALPNLADFSPEMLEQLPSIQIPLPLRKVDGAWRLVLPFKLEEQQAEVINEAALVTKDYFADLAQAIGQAETLDLQAYTQIDTSLQMKHMGPIMGLIGRATAVFGPLFETTTQPTEETAAPTPDEAERSEPEEEAPPEQPTGRRGRGTGRRP